VEVVRSVFFSCVVRLVGPVNTDFLLGSEELGYFEGRAYVVVDAPAIERGHATLGGARVIILDESVVETLGVELLAVSGT
jgi:hypothetical protein